MAFPTGRCCRAYVDVIPQSDEVQLRASRKTTPVDLHVFPNVRATSLWRRAVVAIFFSGERNLKNRSPHLQTKKNVAQKKSYDFFLNSTGKKRTKILRACYLQKYLQKSAGKNEWCFSLAIQLSKGVQEQDFRALMLCVMLA